MRNLLKLFWMPIGIVLLALTFSEPAFASPSCDSLRVDGVSDSQVVQLKQACVEALAKAAQTVQAPVTAQDLSQYAELGKKYGIALSEVAKSVGTTVNDLAQTPVGIFMLVLVGWKVMGHDLLGVVGGAVWFTTMIPLWILFFNRLVLKDRKFDEKLDPTSGKVINRTFYPIKYEDGPGPIAVVMLVVLVVICMAGFIMVF